MNLKQERTIAFAGLIQACAQVQALARTGTADEASLQASVNSILELDAPDTPSVYGGIKGVNAGLQLLKNGVMSSPNPKQVELFRYAMTLMHLTTQLESNRSQFQSFSQHIMQFPNRYAEQDFNELIMGCSKLYQQYISPMRPQLIVQGEEGYLQQQDIPNQVRALLLAGIRSSVLWQQKGGSKLKLVWQRGEYKRVADQLLANS